jgi:uncharacterized OsmC-like protein
MAIQKNHNQATMQLLTNGIDVNQLKDTIQTILKQPEMASFQFRAKNNWIDGGHNQTTLQNYFGANQEITRENPFTCEADEPPVLLGKDYGPNPVEYILTALSACMTTTLAYHAAVNGIQIESIESKLEGDIDLHGFLDLDPKVRKGYREIRVQFQVKSDADREKLELLAKKSPVFDIITNPTPVQIAIKTSRTETSEISKNKGKPAA